MKNFRPVNRYLVVEPIEEKEVGATTVLLPEEYTATTPYGCCRVLAVASDCTRDVHAGQVAVINNTMLEKIEVLGTTLHLILENHILGTTDPTQEE